MATPWERQCQKLVSVACWVLVIARLTSGQHNFPASEYEHSLYRDYIKETEKEAQGKLELSQDEQIVDHYLDYLKWREFEETKDTGFPPLRPIDEMLDHILNSSVYEALKLLPKGGNMHSHEDHQLSKRTLLEIVWASNDFDHLWIQPENSTDHPWMLDFYITPPSEDWVLVKDTSYTRDEILEHQTFLKIMDDHAKRYPSDTGERWRQMDPLWIRGSTQLISNKPIKERYLEELLRQGLSEGVQYLETRKALGGPERMYVLDSSGEYNETNGKRFVDDDGEQEIELTLEVIERIKQENQNFIGFKRINYAHRMAGFDAIREIMLRVLGFHEKYPEHILGFDIVGEEDAGNAHLFYIDNFLEFYDEETGQSRLPVYLHTVETNWPDDLMSSRTQTDLVATLQNSYESVLWQSKRVGHGLGFMKKPVLFDLAHERNVAFEICPVSNQILGFVPDLRNHPAINYFRRGHPIVMGSDDAGSFGVDYFTVDWYEIFMAWGLDLADLKQIALYSLQYSGMSEEEKTEGIAKWTSAWDTYIQDMTTEACGQTFQEDPSFFRILPEEGALQGTTNVHIYGRNFYLGICKDVKCKFGENESPASFVSTNHITCEAPDVSSLLLTRGQREQAGLFEEEDIHVDVHVALDGVNFEDTDLTFTYRHDPIVHTTPVEPGPGSAHRVVLHNFLYVMTFFLIACHTVSFAL